MYFRLFLVAALPSCCAGELSVHGSSETVLAFAGGDVILPCSFIATASEDFPTVEWSREGLQPNVIYLYRDGCETHEMKNLAFQYRTSLIMKELKNGNISLRISNVQLSDAGKYQCMRLWENAPREITTVDLVVGAVSEPKVSVVWAESGGVTLQCEADCWLPEPGITFLDDQGNNISAEDSETNQEAGGCYTVTQRVTLQDATNRVTCRVQQLEINQTRDKEILIPVHCLISCLQNTGAAVGGIVVLLLVAFGLAFGIRKRCSKCGVQKSPVTRQSSDQSTMSRAYENHLLLPNPSTKRAENVENSTIEKLTRELADLKSKLHEKEEIIRNLQTHNKAQQSPVVCQFCQPMMICSPSPSTNSNPLKSSNLPQSQGPNPDVSRQKPASGRPIRRNLSSPAILNLNPAAPSSASSANMTKKRLRSMSDTSAWPGTKVSKPQRQHFSMLPLSPQSSNRFMVLTDVKEESEQLLS